MIGREKEIEEIAEAIFQNCNCGLFFSEAEEIARFVIEEQGYRKQREVAKEIFDEIERTFKGLLNGDISNILKLLSALKKEYVDQRFGLSGTMKRVDFSELINQRLPTGFVIMLLDEVGIRWLD